MALKINAIPPLFTSSLTLLTHKPTTTRICCSAGDDISDGALASEFAARAARINANTVKAEEAMRKSRRLLFGELCEYMGLKEDEAQQKWRKMPEDEKLVLVKGFLAEWGAHFHPLSARSTKEMLDEYIRHGDAPPNPPPASSSFFLDGFNRIIGFP